MKVLGIDPSMTGCGLGIVEDGKFGAVGTINTSPEATRGARLEYIRFAVETFVIQQRPDRVAIEGYAMGARFNREMMGEVGGVLKAMLFQHGIEPAIWQNSSWKKTVLANGKLPKEDVKVAVFQRFNYANKDSNQVEALCVAMAEYMAQTGSPRPKPRVKRKPKENLVGGLYD